MALKQVVRWMRSMTRSMPEAAGVEAGLTGVPPRPVAAAETGICAFVGAFSHGPTGKAVAVSSQFEFERDFGGGRGLGEAPMAVSQFFLNGGGGALLVRTPSNSGASLEEGLNVLAASRTDLFDLLCMPDAVHVADRAVALYEKALAVCRLHRATLLVDPPPGLSGDADMTAWLLGAAPLRSPDTALYYPRLRLSNHADAGPSGSVAGIISRFGRERGVWKAPAGPGATISGAGLDTVVTAQRQELLNPQGINVIRAMGSAGPLVWGSRTLSAEPEWRYLAVRRTVLFIERSLRRGLDWAVFEPNDEPLWQGLRASADGFLEDLWRAGALIGSRPRDAWFVQCGRQTTTDADIRQGNVNMVVGFAPLRPAEFLTFRLDLKAASAAASP
ncbi:phage tail sheath C-terminal domain-containing protein [Emcibacter sp. SYSU 3D8]|uniref:phage tail sheath family protein n=1 Tax=Emcibacter sp. SYSU 3D8 TaxID=3133969 RepID=UPI0031FF25E6